MCVRDKFILFTITILTFGLILICKAQDSLSTRELLKIGNRLYYQTDTVSNYKSCISCHSLQKPDTFYWIPTISEIAPFAHKASFEEFEELILYPYATEKLMESHVNYGFSIEELKALRYFIGSYKNVKEKKAKSITLQTVIIALTMVFIVILILDYSRRRVLHYTLIYFLLILGGVTFIVQTAIAQSRKLKYQEGYQPVQPIKFSHQLHVSDNNIDCRYCHAQAYNYKMGGIPSVQTCYTCHLVTREGRHTGEFELRKLHAAWESMTPIEWVRVNNLPDHVRFHHGIHTKKANISCRTCHGNVENMHEVYQPKSFTMKFCLSCHQSTNVFANGITDSISFHYSGGWDCITCHK